MIEQMKDLLGERVLTIEDLRAELVTGGIVADGEQAQALILDAVRGGHVAAVAEGSSYLIANPGILYD